MLDYVRIGCAVPAVCVADTVKNTEDICAYITEADEQKCDLVVFPELALTGYTCADLFFQEKILKGSMDGLRQIAEHTEKYPDITVAVGDVFMEVVHTYPDITVALTLYHSTIASGVPRMLEHADLRWITPEQIPEFDFCPADVEILQRIREQYK